MRVGSEGNTLRHATDNTRFRTTRSSSTSPKPRVHAAQRVVGSFTTQAYRIVSATRMSSFFTGHDMAGML